MTRTTGSLPLSVEVGLAAYRDGLESFRVGEPLETLRQVVFVEQGVRELMAAAVALASTQGESAGSIGRALNITRQSAHAKVTALGPSFPVIDEDAPTAELIHAGRVTINTVREQHYPLEVYRVAGDELIAIVQDVWNNTSLMNASEKIMAAVKKDWPTAHVLERWLSKSGVGTLGKDGKYAWSNGTGGYVAANLDDLAARGLDVRA